MNPTITLPRQYGQPSTPKFGSRPATSSYDGGSGSGNSSSSLRMPRFFKRLFKPTHLDLELTIWEALSLLTAPKKVFRQLTYHAHTSPSHSFHRGDPSFTYLLSLFMALTGIAWGIAYTNSVGSVVRTVLLFVGGHLVGGCLLVSAVMWAGVTKVLGREGGMWRGLGGGRRRRGLFPREEGESGGKGEGVEFGYCFDVAIRAFFPVWVWVYVVQFLLWPLISRDHWISLFFGNTIYLVAVGYYAVITFLGYNALPTLHHTELILSPAVAFGIFYIISLFGFSMPRHFGPLLLLGAR